MQVINQTTKNEFFVTPHARNRFGERTSGCLMTRLANAVPYGAQRGNDLLLLDDDIVFVADLAGKAIVTCLTKEQAIANMQMLYGGLRDTKFHNEMTHISDAFDGIRVRTNMMSQLSFEDLEQLKEDAQWFITQLKESDLPGAKSYLKETNKLMHSIQHYYKLNAKINRLSELLAEEQTRYKNLKAAVKHVLSSEHAQAVICHARDLNESDQPSLSGLKGSSSDEASL